MIIVNIKEFKTNKIKMKKSIVITILFGLILNSIIVVKEISIIDLGGFSCYKVISFSVSRISSLFNLPVMVVNNLTTKLEYNRASNSSENRSIPREKSKKTNIGFSNIRIEDITNRIIKLGNSNQFVYFINNGLSNLCLYNFIILMGCIIKYLLIYLVILRESDIPWDINFYNKVGIRKPKLVFSSLGFFICNGAIMQIIDIYIRHI